MLADGRDPGIGETHASPLGHIPATDAVIKLWAFCLSRRPCWALAAALQPGGVLAGPVTMRSQEGDLGVHLPYTTWS